MTGQIHDRIGAILRQHGQLTEEQITVVLNVQRESGHPFGRIAQTLFGISREAIERAWTQQYHSFGTEVDLPSQRIDPDIAQTLSRREARQFWLVPLRREDGLLLLATCAERLPRATAFAWRRLGEPVYLLVAPKAQIEEHLDKHYPWSLSCDAQPSKATTGYMQRLTKPLWQRQASQPPKIVVKPTTGPASGRRQWATEQTP